MGEHLRERVLVFVPVRALVDVVGRELPVVLGQVAAAQEAHPLFLLERLRNSFTIRRPLSTR